jgi:hypothetical protein
MARKATLQEALDRAVTEVREVERECLDVASDPTVIDGEERAWRAVARKLSRIAERACYREPLRRVEPKEER